MDLFFFVQSEEFFSCKVEETSCLIQQVVGQGGLSGHGAMCMKAKAAVERQEETKGRLLLCGYAHILRLESTYNELA